jgi:hypothetical protein
VKSSQADLLYYSVILFTIPSELTGHGSRYISAERTWTYSKHISRDRYPASILARRSDLQNTQLPLLLRVGPCLQSYCLATCWSNSLQCDELNLQVRCRYFGPPSKQRLISTMHDRYYRHNGKRRLAAMPGVITTCAIHLLRLIGPEKVMS